MKGSKNQVMGTTPLRRRAEERLKDRSKELDGIPDKKMRELLHELYVHQEELEMQNEELRSAQGAIESSREKYADLFDFAPLGYVICDSEGKIADANLTFAEQIGVKRSHLINKPFCLFIAEEDRDKLHLFQRKVMKNESCHSCELRVVNEDGPGFYALIEGMRLTDAGGAPTFRMSIIDISERRRMEEELIDHKDHLEKLVEVRTAELAEANVALERLAKDAEAASRAKSEFLANMSHEIRTPLQSIVGQTELLSETGLTEEQEEYAKALTKAGDNLLNIVNDILDLSKIEAGKLVLEETPFNLKELMNDILDISASSARKKGLNMNCRIDDDVCPHLMGDPAHLRQILINLINNAVKFTERGGIEVEARSRADEGPGMVEFAVKDTGIGIAPDKLQCIFESFVQADSSSTRLYGGTGLGTTIAKNLVERMGGKIWLESEPGGGSTFSFVIPLKRAMEFKRKGKKPESKEIRRLKILLAEDNEHVRLALGQLMKKARYDLTMVENGEEAINKFKGCDYDLILMDVQMPVMDGYKATMEIRRLEKEQGLKPIPIIALTASAMNEDIQKSIDAGCTLHLTKPIRMEDLFKVIREQSRCLPH